jgi:ABC-type bacteriocin/lantibiotic exporter with double-glycine peptidase domain
MRKITIPLLELFKARVSPLANFFRVLLGPQRVVKVFLSGLTISFLELGGLVLIFPFLKLVTDLDFHKKILHWLGDMPFAELFQDHQRTVLIAGVVIMLIYVLRGGISARLVRYQAEVAAYINSETSEQLIADSLRSRYQLFLEHSPVKIAGISYSNTTHAALLFQSLAIAFNEAVLLGLVLFSLLFANPIIFLGLALLGSIFTLAFFRPLSRRVATIGRQTQEIDLGRHRFVFAMASAIRDIKIMGLEVPFIQRNRDLARCHSRLSAEYISITGAQRMAVEVILVCGVVAAAIMFAWNGGDLNQAAPTIATLGLIAVRSAPSLARLAGAYNGFRYSLPFVEGLLDMRKELEKFPQQRQQQEADFPGEYSAIDLCFSYGERQVLTDCTLTIRQGEIVAVVGPSGAGKSTLLDLLAGLQPPTAGSFFLGGIPFSPFLSRSFPNRVGYVPQTIALLDDTVAFNIALEEGPDPKRLQQAIDRASLGTLVASLSNGLQTLLGDGGQGLSGGQRQRLGIARALYRNPALLILDEVTSALDEATASEVMGELMSMREQVSLLFVTHDLRLVQADRIYKLDQGKLFEWESKADSKNNLEGLEI